MIHKRLFHAEEDIHMTPAEYVIYKFEGLRPAAKALGRYSGDLARWYDPKTTRGRSGFIPANLHITILRVANERGLDITPHDLIYGRTVRMIYE